MSNRKHLICLIRFKIIEGNYKTTFIYIIQLVTVVVKTVNFFILFIYT